SAVRVGCAADGQYEVSNWFGDLQLFNAHRNGGGKGGIAGAGGKGGDHDLAGILKELQGAAPGKEFQNDRIGDKLMNGKRAQYDQDVFQQYQQKGSAYVDREAEQQRRHAVGRQTHGVANDLDHDFVQAFKESFNGGRFFLIHRRHRDSEDQGEEHDRQQSAAQVIRIESTGHIFQRVFGDNVGQDIAHRSLFCNLGVSGCGFGIFHEHLGEVIARFGAQTIAGTEGVNHGDPDQHGNRTDNQAVGKQPKADTSNALQVADFSNSQDKRRQDQRNDRHKDHPEKDLADGLHPGNNDIDGMRVGNGLFHNNSRQDAKNHSQQDAGVQCRFF